MKTGIYTLWENHVIGGCALNHRSQKGLCTKVWDVCAWWLCTVCDRQHMWGGGHKWDWIRLSVVVDRKEDWGVAHCLLHWLLVLERHATLWHVKWLWVYLTLACFHLVLPLLCTAITWKSLCNHKGFPYNTDLELWPTTWNCVWHFWKWRLWKVWVSGNEWTWCDPLSMWYHWWDTGIAYLHEHGQMSK